MTPLEEAQKRFLGDRFATENGAEIRELGDGYAVCAMAIGDRHRNAIGRVMGGALFTLGDFAFAVASNQNGRTVVSSGCQITFLASAGGSTLFATAQRVREGRRTAYYEVSVTDDTGALVARMTCNGMVVG